MDKLQTSGFSDQRGRLDFSAQLRATQSRPLVMGILNVTPDSFSDGGRFVSIDAAVAAARSMVKGGADWIDVGGESTRPGSVGVSAAEQIDRVAPVIAAVCREFSIPVSIDTSDAVVAAAALDAGASIVNDVTAGRADFDLLPLVARRKVPVILMHMRGTPADMQVAPAYEDVISEVMDFLRERASYAESVGVDPADILIDPGIGFGKTVEHNLQLLRGLSRFTSFGHPVVVGTSRKGFIGKITGEADLADRVLGTAATVAWTAMHGAAVVRVHDVAAMDKVVRMIRAIRDVKICGQ